MAAAGPASAQSTIRDTEIEGIIRGWADPVFVAMGLDPSEVEVLLINDPDLNAFATRGRIIGVNTGLILQTETRTSCWASWPTRPATSRTATPCATGPRTRACSPS